MLVKLIALVLPLGLDTFAVAAALGMLGVGRDRRLRISVIFSSFEAGMPLIGLALGAPLGRALGSAADYVAIAVLLAFGLYTLLGSDEGDEARLEQLAELRGPGAFLLGVSVSVDELAIGFTLGLLRLPVVLVIILIAIQTLVITQLGLRLGQRLGAHLRELSERLAGVALAALAIGLLADKVLS